MRRLLFPRALIALCSCVWIGGCPVGAKHADAAQTVGSGLLAACDDDSQCVSKLCTFGLYSVNEPGVCSKSCSSNADCKSSMGARATCREVAAIPEVGAKQKQSSWRKACVLPCKDSDPGVFECKDGVRAFCEDAMPPSCVVCGCAEGNYCAAHDEQCKPYGHGGEACKEDGECLSGRCAHDKCTSGPGDACDDACDGTCGGPADALYCMPACKDRCPVRMHGWECIGDAGTDQYCGRVCKSETDCVGDGDVCDPFPMSTANSAWPYYFTGFCHQPRDPG